jgi:hypothetical protein|tara:strand:+ start:2681 stop:2977 length:297 start_codon:yes stop_codon:yes gene_type:complete
MGFGDSHIDVCVGNVLSTFLCTHHSGWLLHIHDNNTVARLQGDKGHVCRFSSVHILPFEIRSFVGLFPIHVVTSGTTVYDSNFKLFVLKTKILIKWNG